MTPGSPPRSSNLRERGQYNQAKPLAEQALEVIEAALGPDDVAVAWQGDELGRVLQSLGDLAGARTQFEQADRAGMRAVGGDVAGGVDGEVAELMEGVVAEQTCGHDHVVQVAAFVVGAGGAPLDVRGDQQVHRVHLAAQRAWRRTLVVTTKWCRYWTTRAIMGYLTNEPGRCTNQVHQRINWPQRFLRRCRNCPNLRPALIRPSGLSPMGVRRCKRRSISCCTSGGSCVVNKTL
ncbi:tetratricopeptide repeat protein [Dactylosporangium sp. NPDC048998]|uniref:tetratricopeptide repeat protein n=1 Tax=Dactylosporangium sp. NPDC048998 TaxID=3363976 RepID=UPI0037230307